MKALVLAAGYGTRLSAVTKGVAKPLVDVSGTTILGRIIEDIIKIKDVDEIYVVTNDKFYPQFTQWKKENVFDVPVVLVNDGTNSNENRLGAIGDINLVIDFFKIQEDLLIVAGDSLYEFELKDFVTSFKTHKMPCMCVKQHSNKEELSRFGIVEKDSYNNIISFEEKPVSPKSDLVGYAIYIYPRKVLSLFKGYMQSGRNTDAPGNFVKYLTDIMLVKAYPFEGKCLDIGTPESLEEARAYFKNR
ncbi:MAG: sugar phosphate nucleotidyltransferase [Clostridia bacterium]